VKESLLWRAVGLYLISVILPYMMTSSSQDTACFLFNEVDDY